MSLIRRLPGKIYTNRNTIFSLILFCLILTYFLFKFNFVCLNLQAWQHVKKVCKLHARELAVGSLCIPLCVTKDIHSLTCHSFQSTKEAVFSAEWHDTKLVFKLASNDVQSLHWYDNDHIKYPTEKEFLSTPCHSQKQNQHYALS